MEAPVRALRRSKTHGASVLREIKWAYARVARELSQRRLEAEQSKFDVGLSTNYFVVQAQRDLQDAENALLRAILDYQQSLVDYERVQQTSGSGGGGGITFSNTNTTGTGGNNNTTSIGNTGTGGTGGTGTNIPGVGGQQ